MAAGNDESLTRLTEFAPLSSEVKPASFFQRLFKKTGNGRICKIFVIYDLNYSREVKKSI